MTRLRHHDLHALSAFLLDLYASTDLRGFGGVVVRGVPKLVPAETCAVNYIDPDTTQPAWISAGAEYPMNRRMFAAHIREHPIPAHFRDTGCEGWRRLSDVTTREAFHRTTFYNEWYRPRGIEHQLITLFPDGRGRFVAVALLRDGRRDFTDRECSVGDLLFPHLIGAYRASLRASRAHQTVALLAGGLESAKVGLVLLNEGGGIKHASLLARRWLAEYFGCRRYTRPPTRLLGWMAQFTRDRTGACGRREPLIVKTAGRQLTIEAHAQRHGAVLLLREKVTEISPPMLDPLGLTPREAEVLTWVAEGKRDNEIGVILGLSTRTVNHHLERVYRKLGVETRTAAASRAREVVNT